MKKHTKRIIAFMLTVIIVFCCVPAVYAESVSDNFEEGAVLVGFSRDIKRVQDIAPELDIERVELAEMDYDYIPYSNTGRYLFVKVYLTEKTKQATLDAIELFKTKENVIIAEPYYTVYTRFEAGGVVVSLELGESPSILQDVLKDYEVESIRLITPGSSTQNVYHLTFAEKTKEIVVEVLPLLRACKGVEIAVPNYMRNLCVEPKKGDADRDNRVTVMDATTIQLYLAQHIKASDFDYEAAIVTDNYKLTIMDATIIQQKLAGFDVDF